MAGGTRRTVCHTARKGAAVVGSRATPRPISTTVEAVTPVSTTPTGGTPSRVRSPLARSEAGKASGKADNATTTTTWAALRAGTFGQTAQERVLNSPASTAQRQTGTARYGGGHRALTGQSRRAALVTSVRWPTSADDLRRTGRKRVSSLSPTYGEAATSAAVVNTVRASKNTRRLEHLSIDVSM